MDPKILALVGRIAAATKEARQRTGDNRITTSVEKGRYDLVYGWNNKGKWAQEMIAADLSGEEVISALNAL